jgi:hypothetical protein
MQRLFMIVAGTLMLGGVRPVLPTSSAFQLTVARTRVGFHMKCVKGCAWSELSVSCAAGCPVVVDSLGVSTDTSTEDRTPGFAIVLHRAAHGWSATSIRGTAWSRVSWGCAVGRCPARLNALGVSGPSILDRLRM